METIKEGEYLIPAELTASIREGRLIVKPRVSRKLTEDDLRCRNCKHYAKGHTIASMYVTTVCLKKPKEKEGLYYSASPYGKICGYFEKREEVSD